MPLNSWPRVIGRVSFVMGWGDFVVGIEIGPAVEYGQLLAIATCTVTSSLHRNLMNS